MHATIHYSLTVQSLFTHYSLFTPQDEGNSEALDDALAGLDQMSLTIHDSLAPHSLSAAAALPRIVSRIANQTAARSSREPSG